MSQRTEPDLESCLSRRPKMEGPWRGSVVVLAQSISKSAPTLLPCQSRKCFENRSLLLVLLWEAGRLLGGGAQLGKVEG